jgi:hypothetical protein
VSVVQAFSSSQSAAVAHRSTSTRYTAFPCVATKSTVGETGSKASSLTITPPRMRAHVAPPLDERRRFRWTGKDAYTIDVEAGSNANGTMALPLNIGDPNDCHVAAPSTDL